jgi:hypothetical protein
VQHYDDTDLESSGDTIQMHARYVLPLSIYFSLQLATLHPIRYRCHLYIRPGPSVLGPEVLALYWNLLRTITSTVLLAPLPARFSPITYLNDHIPRPGTWIHARLTHWL